MRDSIPVLDCGYVRLVETWGLGDARLAEAGIVEAARQSTQGSFRGWDQDERLLRFLHLNRHSTPFEFAGMTIEVQAPIVVFREWHRHRTQSYSEMSARYSPVPDQTYLPTVERCLVRPDGNKQAGAVRGSEELTAESATDWLRDLSGLYERCESVYADGLRRGVPKELARLAMPVARYSRMRATANLRNWLGFLALRLDPAAQLEIRQYAGAVGRIVEAEFARTWSLFVESGKP